MKLNSRKEMRSTVADQHPIARLHRPGQVAAVHLGLAAAAWVPKTPRVFGGRRLGEASGLHGGAQADHALLWRWRVCTLAVWF